MSARSSLKLQRLAKPGRLLKADTCRDNGPVVPIEMIAGVSRKHMHMKMPHILSTSRFIVLTSRNTRAGIRRLQSNGDALDDAVNRKSQIVGQFIEILNVRVRHYQHVTPIAWPLMRRHERRHKLLAKDYFIGRSQYVVSEHTADNRAERAAIPIRCVIHPITAIAAR